MTHMHTEMVWPECARPGSLGVGVKYSEAIYFQNVLNLLTPYAHAVGVTLFWFLRW